MKRHSAWVAFGLLLFVVLACNLSKNKNGNINVNVNVNSGSDRPANAQVYTEEVYAAKEANGSPTTTFSGSDRTVHVVINLNKAKAGTDVRVVWFADEVEGASNKQLKTLEHTSKASEQKVSAYLRWPEDWPHGTYKVEVYINGVLDKTIYYTVE